MALWVEGMDIKKEVPSSSDMLPEKLDLILRRLIWLGAPKVTGLK